MPLSQKSEVDSNGNIWWLVILSKCYFVYPQKQVWELGLVPLCLRPDFEEKAKNTFKNIKGCLKLLE
jgi:hypothetical protein